MTRVSTKGGGASCCHVNSIVGKLTWRSGGNAALMTDLSDEELQEVYAWIDEIPLTRQKKNMTRDFSDGVLTAEVVHHFLPKYVDLHNYSSANAIQQKITNWRTLNS